MLQEPTPETSEQRNASISNFYLELIIDSLLKQFEANRSKGMDDVEPMNVFYCIFISPRKKKSIIPSIKYNHANKAKLICI